MTGATKNSVVVGFVAYFVGLSLMGLMIYRFSQPRLESTSVVLKSAASEHSTGAVVEYETVAGAEAVAAPDGAAPPAGPPVPGSNQAGAVPSQTAASPGAIAPGAAAPGSTAAGDNEWN